MAAAAPPPRIAARVVGMVLAVLVSPCVVRAMPQPQASSYGSSIYHVQSPVPSSHQSVTLSESHELPHGLHALERSHEHEHEHDPPQPYKFEYKVHDQKNSNYHERAESSDGQVVRGFYSLLEPHGEVRVVKYRADHGGFQSEVSRHGSRHGGEAHGGGLGATIGGGPAHDLGSHGLGVSASVSHPVSHPAPHQVSHSAPHQVSHQVSHSVAIPSSSSPAKQSIPIHEEPEDSNQWSAIEDPKKAPGLQRGQALEEIPAPSKEAFGSPGSRVPEQFLLQHKKKKASFQALHAKPSPNLHNKFLNRPPPSLHLGPRPGGNHGGHGGHGSHGGHRLPPHFHRGPKRGPGPGPVGPRPRHALAGPPASTPGSSAPPAQPQSPSHPSPQRREARPPRPPRPPPTPCKCSEQPPGHAAGHTPALGSLGSQGLQSLQGRKLT